MALITILEDHPPDSELRIIGALIFTVLTVMLAESFAHLLGQQIDFQRRLSLNDIGETVKELSAVTLSVNVPVILFILSMLNLISLQGAFTLSKVASVALILVYGYMAGRLSGRSWYGSLIPSLAYTALGGVIVLLKIYVH